MSERSVVRKAVLPVAGLGTRFLPATKATPKEMLPVVDKPAIQYVVEEAAAAGILDLLFVTGRNKSSLENHFDRDPRLEDVLSDKQDHDSLPVIKELAELAQIHYVRQGAPRGLGHAVSMAKQHVGDEPFVVMLGDDLVDASTPVLESMMAVRARFGGSVLCLMEVAPQDIHLYGCARVEPTDVDGVVRVVELVEKPETGSAPSNLAVIGRYILDPSIFDVLDKQQPGRNGEIQLTDSIAQLIDSDGHDGVHAVVFSGKRYDTGDKLSYLQAVISIALEREDLGPDLRAWLGGMLADNS